MIEKFILSVIKFLNYIKKELQRAYTETYGDKELSKEFTKELNRRRTYNKNNFISSAAASLQKQIYDNQGIVIPEKLAREIGEIVFFEAQQKDLIDFLYRVKEKRN